MRYRADISRTYKKRDDDKLTFKDAVKILGGAALIYVVFIIGMKLAGFTFFSLANPFTWRNHEEFKKNTIYYYTGNSCLIKMEIEAGVETEEVAKLITFLDEAPRNLIKRCFSIRITNGGFENAVTEECLKSVMFDEAFVLDDSVFFSSNFAMNRITTYHEMAHIYDHNHGYPSSDEKWKEIYMSDEFLEVLLESNDMRRGYSEGWATGIAFFYAEPEKFERICPDGYEYFKNIELKD